MFYAYYRGDSERKYQSVVRRLANLMDRNVFAMRLLAAVAGEPYQLERIAESLQEGKVMDHIGQLMHFSELTDKQREILDCLALMPNSEMLEVLVRGFGFAEDDLAVLLKKGWLVRNKFL